MLQNGTGCKKRCHSDCSTRDFRAEYAYEYVYKQDIVSCVGCLHFSDEDAKKLLSYKHLLDFLYDEWMYCDVTAIDALENCILDTVKNL